MNQSNSKWTLTDEQKEKKLQCQRDRRFAKKGGKDGKYLWSSAEARIRASHSQRIFSEGKMEPMEKVKIQLNLGKRRHSSQQYPPRRDHSQETSQKEFQDDKLH